MDITTKTNEDYDRMTQDWPKFRLVFEGGKCFVNKYLKKWSIREDSRDFEDRKCITYSPAHAKAGVMDIKNAIYQRLVDINRTGGTASYQKAVKGENGGVDRAGNTMKSFIGRCVIEEMLIMKRVGVFIDRAPLTGPITKADEKAVPPYLYTYKAEQIRDWEYDSNNKLVTLLLTQKENIYDQFTGLVTKKVDIYKLYNLTPKGVLYRKYDADGQQDGPEILFKLKKIPFVMFEISESLLKEAADMQIALLNLGSSDLVYALKANYPFYIEQYDASSIQAAFLRQAQDTSQLESGQQAQEKAASPEIINTGLQQGRRYGKDLNPPAFIHPSPEPLRVSMEKQAAIVKEIREVINLSLSNIEPKRASAESKQLDQKGLEAGLSWIGLELEQGEREIAECWSDYEASKEIATINYPKNYSLRSDDDRIQESKDLNEQAAKFPSKTAQKECIKASATLLLGTRVSNEILMKIHTEIDSAIVPIIDAETVVKDVETGLVTMDTASQIRGYPKGEAEKAKTEAAEKAALIVQAQQKVTDVKDARQEHQNGNNK